MVRRTSLLGFAVASCIVMPLAMIGVPAPATAQQSVGINPGRDCQTVRTCNFSRYGQVRGCLSSYTCRVCRMVPARCNLGDRGRCGRLVCSWGG